MEIFSNREIATGFWLAAVSVFVLRNGNARESFCRVAEGFLHPKIVFPVFLFILYQAGVVWYLERVGFWTSSLLKDTLFWLFLGGFVMLFQFATSRQDEHLLRAVLRDSLKLVLILEFLVATYTFSLWVELILVPFIGSVAMLNAAAATDEKYRPVEKLTGNLISLFGLIVLVYVVQQLISGFSTLDGNEAVRQILVAPLLSLALVPFIFLLQVWATYEQLFLRIDIGADKPASVQDYARRRLVTHFKLQPRQINAFLRAHAGHLMSIRTTEDIDRLLSGKDGGPDWEKWLGGRDQPNPG